MSHFIQNQGLSGVGGSVYADSDASSYETGRAAATAWVPALYPIGTSVVVADLAGSPVMTILRRGMWGHRTWYVVAWRDAMGKRHETFFSEEELAPTSRTEASYG